MTSILEIKEIKELKKILKGAFQVQIKELKGGNLINIDGTRIFTNVKTSTIINLVELDTYLDIEQRRF